MCIQKIIGFSRKNGGEDFCTNIKNMSSIKNEGEEIMKLQRLVCVIIVVILLITLPVRAQTVEEWKLKGNDFVLEKKYEEALECYNKALELGPDDPKDLTGLGNCFSSMKEYVRGLECYDKALKIDPDFVPALLNKSLCLFSISMNEETEKKYVEGKEILVYVKGMDPEFKEIDVTDKYQDNITLLHIAAIYRDIDLVALLLSRQIDVNINAMFGFTPFHLACLNGFANSNSQSLMGT